MQGVFTLYPKQLQQTSNEYQSMYRTLDTLAARLVNIKNTFHDNSYADIKSALNTIYEDILQESAILRTMETVLNNCLTEYIHTEERISGIQAAETPSDYLPLSSDTSQDILKELLPLFLKYYNASGCLNSAATPFLKMFLNAALGIETSPVIIAEVLKSPFNQFVFFSEVADKGWAEAFRKGIGLSHYFENGITPGLKYGQYFKTYLENDLKAYTRFSTLKNGAKAMAKWAGVAVTSISNGFENYEEYQNGDISSERAVVETVIETGVDVGLGALATAGTAAGLAALGVAGAPAIAVAAVGTTVVLGANWLCEEITGNFFGEEKDIGEAIADGICDIGNGIAEWFS